MPIAASIVIRAYNEAQHINRLLDGICQQNLANYEIILVDSGSTDGTPELAAQYIERRAAAPAQGTAAQYPAPLTIVHIQPDEFTFGRSLNRGIQAAKGEYIVIASAHVYPVYPDWLERLLAPFADSKVGLTYGKQRGAATTHFSEHQVFAHWFPDSPQAPLYQNHPFCNNANAAIRRSLWEQHPYDETISGLEDLAWANWLLQNNHAIVYVPEAEIIHVHQETPGRVYNRYRREAMAFKRIFPHEHFGLGDFFRLVTSNIASDIWHAAQQKVLCKSLGSIFWFRSMQFWGTYQGYRRSGPLTWHLRRTFYYPRQVGKERSQNQENVQRNVAPIQYNKE